MPHKNKQKNKSLCEKSMEVMVNIIKLSSSSLATQNLCYSNRPTITHTPNKPFTSLSNSEFSKNKKSQSQVNKSKMQTHLMEQDAGDPSHSSSTIVHGDNIDDHVFSDFIKRFHMKNQNEWNTEVADGKASAYIRKFHEKISRDNTLAAPASFPLVVPPPPSLLKK